MAGHELSEITTRAELGDAIQQLVDRRSTRQLAYRFKQLLNFDAETGLPPTRASTSHSVIAYWYQGKKFPGRAELRLLLRSAGESPGGANVDDEQVRRWEEAVMRVEKGDLRRGQVGTAEAPGPTAPLTRMQEVRDHISERQAREYAEATTDIFKELAQDPSRERLLSVLRIASEGGLITTAGVCTPIWETDLHYRYVLGEAPELQVNIESDDQRALSTTVWADGTTPEDFYWQLVEAVRAEGADLGVGLNDPTESIERLSEMLVDVAKLRSQELMGHRYTLANIIERKDDWYFTERYVIPGGDLHYTIEVARLNEMDWEEHLHGRFEGIDNISFARRMYGTGETRFQPLLVEDDELGELEAPAPKTR
jgi:hypothetical protein